MWNAKTTTASDKLQILPLMRCLKKNDYDIQVISYNAKYTCNEIENIEQPEICFIGKMRHDVHVEDGDRFCQFHLTTAVNIKRRGSKIACLYSDNVCEYDSPDAQLYKNLLYLSDLVITPSKKLQEHAKKRIPKHAKLITIPDPLFLEEKPFKRLSSNQDCNIIWFGHNKNLEYLTNILPNLISNSDAKIHYILTILASRGALESFQKYNLQKLPKSNNWSLRLVPWNIYNQPAQLIEELSNSHISIIPSDPNDPLKNGVSHNRLIDSIQSGCITLASPMDSYVELSKICLIGTKFSELLRKAVQDNARLCRKYETLRPGILDYFNPKRNLQLWDKALRLLEANN